MFLLFFSLYFRIKYAEIDIITMDKKPQNGVSPKKYDKIKIIQLCEINPITAPQNSLCSASNVTVASVLTTSYPNQIDAKISKHHIDLNFNRFG